MLFSGIVHFLLSNESGNELAIQYDQASNTFLIDRSKTGDTSFHDQFDDLIKVPRLLEKEEMKIKLVVDVASVELFVDDGSSVSTVIFFPDEVLNKLSIETDEALEINDLTLREVSPVFRTDLIAGE